MMFLTNLPESVHQFHSQPLPTLPTQKMQEAKATADDYDTTKTAASGSHNT